MRKATIPTSDIDHGGGRGKNRRINLQHWYILAKHTEINMRALIQGPQLHVLLTALLLLASSSPVHSFVAPFSSNGHLPIPTSLATSRASSSSSTQLFLAKRTKKKARPKSNTICLNRNARRNYEVIETMEAGVSLLGTEVKSIRDGKMNIRDGYIRATKDGRSCILFNVHIGKHAMSGEYFQHEERRERRLLVHKQQARKLLQQTETSGMTIVPLKAYFNDQNKVKLEIGLCKGKNVRDKRADIKNRENKREEQRIIKSFRV